MPEIHATAFVDERAELADDVIIGPNSSIVGRVKIGAGTRMIGHAILNGPLTLGQRNLIYPFSCLGYAPQDRSYNPRHDGAGVVIGDDNVFRESVTINRATGEKPTTLGSHNYFMACAHVAHDVVIGSRNNFANSALLAGHAWVGDQVNMAGNAAVAQHCRVGRLAMIGGEAGITRDVPPFCMVYYTRRINSLNLVGMRRAGLRESIRPMTIAFDILFRQAHTNQSALEIIRDDEIYEDPCVREFVTFIEGSERGLTQYGGEFVGE